MYNELKAKTSLVKNLIVFNFHSNKVFQKVNNDRYYSQGKFYHI